MATRTWRFRGRTVTSADLVFIRQLIAATPQPSRCALSRQICEAWNWKQPNGVLCDQVCRSLLLMLDRAGEIHLPAMRRRPANPLAYRQPPKLLIAEQRPIQGPLSALQPLEFVPVRRTPNEALFNSLIEQHHYLGYEQPVGEHLKYLVRSGISAHAIVSSAGTRQRGAGTFVSSPTTRAI